MTAERSSRAGACLGTPFNPNQSHALDRAVVALEAAHTQPARHALRRMETLLEPQPRKAVRQ